VRHGQAGPDILHELSRRELIGELCRELKDHFDLSGIEALIVLMDDNLCSCPVSVQRGEPERADAPVFDRNRKPRSSARG